MHIEHITLRVKSLKESQKFYEEAAGLKLAGDLRPMGSPIVFYEDKAGDTKIELIEAPAEALGGKGISIGFHTEDVEAKRAELEAIGLNPTPMISPNPHVKFFFVNDPDGVQIQFI